MSVGIGLTVADMPFVECKLEFPYLCLVCDVLKAASAEEFFENNLWAFEIS